MEIWMDIQDYEGLYQISNFANVKSLERKVRYNSGGLRTEIEKPLKPRLNTSNRRKKYYVVFLYKNRHRKMFRIHRLVAQQFIPNPHNLPQVNHIDNNPLNNHYTNLEWTTNRKNVNHGLTFRETSSKYPGVCWDKTREKWKSEIRINGKIKHLGRFTCELEAAEAYQNALKQLT